MSANPGGGDYFPEYAPRATRPFHHLVGRQRLTFNMWVDENQMDEGRRANLMAHLLGRAVGYFAGARPELIDWDTLEFRSSSVPVADKNTTDASRAWEWSVWTRES